MRKLSGWPCVNTQKMLWCEKGIEMITKRNDLIRQFQRQVVVQMTQSFQWGSITIPSYQGKIQDSLAEAQFLIDETRRVIDALDSLKDPEPEKKEENQ